MDEGRWLSKLHKEELVPFPGSRLKNLIYIDVFFFFFPKELEARKIKPEYKNILKWINQGISSILISVENVLTRW